MKKKLLIIASILCAAASSLYAQNNAQGIAAQPVYLGLSNAIELTFPNGNATQTAEFGTILDLLNGKELPDTDVKVRSNKAFKVQVAAATNNFDYTGGALLKPILSAASVIRMKVVSNNTGGNATGSGWLFLNSLSTSPVTILNNCDPGDNQTFSIKYKMIPGLTLPSGTYSVDMVLTATQL